ncbi:MAG: SRPBCC family protein [Pseudomonadota bacterium]
MNDSTPSIDWTAFSRTCVRVDTEVEIARGASAVFDYVTTAALWHTWHPATAQVRDAPPRPLIEGETMLEVIAMLGQRELALWRVLVCEPGQRWEIATVSARGAAHISYRLTPTARGCRFQRTLEFRSRAWPWRWLDNSLLRALLARQSARALRNLADLLQGAPR